MTLRQLQELIQVMYSRKDRQRGPEATFLWLTEEFGELASAIRGSSKPALAAEFADVLAWLATLANILDVDLTDALEQKYGRGCPGCGAMVCQCDDGAKP